MRVASVMLPIARRTSVRCPRAARPAADGREQVPAAQPAGERGTACQNGPRPCGGDRQHQRPVVLRVPDGERPAAARSPCHSPCRGNPIVQPQAAASRPAAARTAPSTPARRPQPARRRFAPCSASIASRNPPSSCSVTSRSRGRAVGMTRRSPSNGERSIFPRLTAWLSTARSSRSAPGPDVLGVVPADRVDLRAAQLGQRHGVEVGQVPTVDVPVVLQRRGLQRLLAAGATLGIGDVVRNGRAGGVALPRRPFAALPLELVRVMAGANLMVPLVGELPGGGDRQPRPTAPA